MDKTALQDRIFALEWQMREKDFQLERWETQRESLERWQKNLEKEDMRQREAWQQFLKRVENGVQIRTIKLQHELKVANFKLQALEIQHAESQSLVQQNVRTGFRVLLEPLSHLWRVFRRT